MPYSLIVDVLVAVLLVITICYAITLNRRLGGLRRDRTQLEKLAVTFGESTARAEESILKLKKTADLLQERIDKAQSLRDDLAFLIDRGGQAADNLEDLVRVTRESVGVKPRAARPAANEPAPRPAPAPMRPEANAGHSEAERELLRAIRSAN